MRPLLFALATSLSLIAADTARAACLDALEAAVQEVDQTRAVSDPTLTAVGSACAGDPAAVVVHELVRRGRCDAGAQLGRAQQAWAGPSLDAALEAADTCLAQAVADKLDDLAATAQAAQEAEAWGDEAGSYGLGGLGTRGVGKGGGGAGSGYGRGADRDAGDVGLLGNVGTERRSRRATAAEPAAKPNAPRASTGAGRYVASATSSKSPLADGTAIAWSRLDLVVWFDYDSAGLRPEALETLAVLARRIREMRPGTVLEIVGHTDSKGTWSYNHELSTRRARSVERALALAGVQRDTLGIRGMGESDPVESNRSAWGRARNRRVEFRFLQPVARIAR